MKCKLFVKSQTLLIALFFLLISCGIDDGANHIFKFDITSNPRTLDPQTATDESSRLIISNIYEGLLKIDERGNIVSAVAGEYFVSEDGLIYTFLLKDNIYWYNEESDGKEPVRCTADDFVFAFRRLVNPATKSQNAVKFYSIKNAQAIHTGRISDLTRLGVEALSDFQLVVRLEYANIHFPNLLTTTPAMPCNEEFYLNSKGRYGLSAQSVISNGAFYLHSWSYDKYSTVNNNLILRRNVLNDEQSRIYPYGLNFFIEESDKLSNFQNGVTHSIVVSGEEAISIIEQDYPYDQYENFSWGIVFNTEGVFSDTDIRYALAASFDRTFSLDERGYSEAKMLIPPALMMGDDSYRNLAGDESYIEANPFAAKVAFNRAIEETGISRLNGLNILVEDNKVIRDYLSHILQKWQKELGFYCNIKIVSKSEIKKEIDSGNFDFAAVRISGDYNSPSAYLNYFSDIYSNRQFLNDIDKAEKSADFAESVRYYSNAERRLIEDAVFIPLCFQTEYFVYQKGCDGISYNPFTDTINYREARIIAK